ncbi:MAG: hypothetical protein JWO85_3667 [Candidatus Eremiobacteraeota bacterium]|nr:hypothetical protein [Candidatus Eremiobacteraeota bacterium]
MSALAKKKGENSRRRREWFTGEEQILIDMWRAGKSGTAIATALARSNAGVYCHIAKNYKRLGIEPRTAPKWHAAEERAVAKEVELAIRRIAAALPHRKRPTLTQRMTEYLMGDAKRLSRAAASARIEDVGGMRDDAHVRDFGTPRSEHKHSRAPRKEAA